MQKLNSFQYESRIHYDDYITRDHRVEGIRILPGVTFLDMIARILENENISVKDVVFQNILFQDAISVTEEYDSDIVTKATKLTDDKYQVTVESNRVKGDRKTEPVTYSNYSGQLVEDNCEEPSIAPVKQWMDEAEPFKDMEDVYSNTRKLNIVHYDFMRAQGKIWKGKDYLIARLSLGDLAKEYEDEFYIHPCLLDASTIVALSMHHENYMQSRPYIPIYLKKFKVYRPLSGDCYVYVPFTMTTGMKPRDVYYSDFTIYNEKGEAVAEFEKLAAKQVRTKDSLVNKKKAKVQTTREVSAEGKPVTEKMIKSDLKRIIADIIKIPEEDINDTSVFYDLGLESSDLLDIVHILEQRVNEELYPILLFEYTNIQSLASHLFTKYGTAYRLGDNETPVEEQKPKPQIEKRTEIVDSKSVGIQITEMIREIAQISVEQREWETGFYEIGMDSMNLIDLVNRLEQQFQIELYPTLLFEYTSVKSLSDYLIQNYSEQLSGKTEEKTEENQIDIPQQSQLIYITEKWEEQSAYRSEMDKLETELVLCAGDNELNNCQKAFPNAYCFNYLNILPEQNQFETQCKQVLDKLTNRPKNIVCLGSDRQAGEKLFLFVKCCMKYLKGEKVRILYIWNETDDIVQNACEEAVFGLLKTVSQENPLYEFRCIKNVSDTDLQSVVKEEWNGWNNVWNEVSYMDGMRFIRKETQLPTIQDSQAVLPADKTYLITGGLGGVGYIWAEYLLRECHGNVILIGKSQLTGEKQEQFSKLQEIRQTVAYYSCDLTDKKALEEVIQKGKERFGNLYGVIHAAGIIKDRLILEKGYEDFKKVTDTKILGAVNLDEILLGEKLEFFALFSSTAARVGNLGQSDYTFANGFLDSFAAYRDKMRKSGKRFGKTISIGWSYWKDGGMQLSESEIRKMEKNSGFYPIEAEEGIQLFRTALNLNHSHVLAIKGEPDIVSEKFSLQPANIVTEKVYIEEKQESQPQQEDIAIIGISGKYPQAHNLDEFWKNLKEGRDCITEIPKERWDYHEMYDPNRESFGTSYTKWGGFLDDIDKFDALFFRISPREAQLLDPQERLFLETVWETMEDGGYTGKALEKEKVGVFAAAMWTHYDMFQAKQNGKSLSPMVTHASIANRISYFFNFKGPSIAVDTMCSSSLTALHLACQSIKSGECSYAVVGGVNLSLHANKYISLSHQRFVSSDGKCRSFGEGGDGYVPGEGTGAVLIKRYSDAVKDHDNIYGIIKATSLNACGTTSGYTVPSPVMQMELIQENIEKAGILPEQITAIEAHGTGTSLGDPIEIEGLMRAFSNCNGKENFCSVGSVKSNIGHLEGAAGMASITKILLEMKYKKLVPSIHSDTMNKAIKLEHTPFYIQHTLEDWNVHDSKRYGAISSFGAGGANAHVILEEYTGVKHSSPEEEKGRIFVLSAKNQDSLDATLKKLYTYIKEQEEITLKDIAYTLQVGRVEMEERFAMAVNTKDELTKKLGAYLDGTLDEREYYVGNTRHQTDALDDIEVDYTQKPEVLALLWTRGKQIDFERLYAGEEKPYHISIPGYTFRKKRYWVDDFVKQATVDSVVESKKEPVKEKMKFDPDTVSLQILEDHIALVRLQDKKGRNTFTDDFMNGIEARFQEIKENPEIKCVIVTGYENIFSMGGTQQQLINISESKSSFTDTPFLYRGFLEFDIPVIAAIQGHATGGGFLFGLYADMVVLAEESIYTAVFTKYGFTPGMGATYILEERLGKAVATEMMYSARPFSGQELKERGVGVPVVKREDVLSRAISIAQSIADKPLVTLKTLKHELSRRILSPLLACIDAEEEMHKKTFTQPEVKERIKHFYINSEKNEKEDVYSKLIQYIQEEKISPDEAIKLKNSMLGDE